MVPAAKMHYAIYDGHTTLHKALISETIKWQMNVFPDLKI